MLNYIKSKRELYLPVSVEMIQNKALKECSDESFSASKNWAFNFLKRNNLAIRKKTQKIKQISDDYIQDAEKYIKRLDEIRSQYDDILFINFDEVNLPFELGTDYTIRRAQIKSLY